MNKVDCVDEYIASLVAMESMATKISGGKGAQTRKTLLMNTYFLLLMLQWNPLQLKPVEAKEHKQGRLC